MADDAVLNLIKQIEDQLPPELVAQLKLPAQQEQFTMVADDVTKSYFDVDAPASADVVDVADTIVADTQFNVQTTAQKQRQLDARASAEQKSARSQFKASAYMPSIPRRYSGGK